MLLMANGWENKSYSSDGDDFPNQIRVVVHGSDLDMRIKIDQALDPFVITGMPDSRLPTDI